MTASKSPSVEDDIFVSREIIMALFSPALKHSTFHNRAKNGDFVACKGLRGYYALNATRKKLGLPLVDTQAYRKERETRPEAMCSRQKVFLALSALIPEITLIFESDELPETLSQSEREEIVKYVAAYQQALEEDHITEPTARLAFARGVLEAEGGSSPQ